MPPTLRSLRVPIAATALYGATWMVAIGAWRASHLTDEALGAWGVGIALGLALLVAGGWIAWAHLRPKTPRPVRAAVWSLAFLLVHPFVLYGAEALEFYETRAIAARIGTTVLFLVGLGWVVWILERTGRFYERIREEGHDRSEADVAAFRSSPDRMGIEPDRPVWNPFDLAAWYWNVGFWEWFTPKVLFRARRLLDDPDYRAEGRPQRRLNQTLSAFVWYSATFLAAFLVLSNLRGCEELYEMPAGGGEQKQLAVQQKIQKVIKKKYVINPFSSISFKVPPIDDVKLQLTEITKHAYKVGQGAGDGAGFSGGTNRGKVRFIRLEYAGGDWDQDFGVGADVNMLVQYGVRTSHKTAEKTESRTVSELANFPLGKSPPFVFLTGQKNVSLSNSEVKILREYVLDKHGMLFVDNGGSAHFHNQILALMNRVLPSVRPVPVPLDDQIHRVPYAIPFLPYVAPHGGREALGWKVDGRWVCYYHPGDIGDAWSDDHSGVRPEVWEACYQLGTNVIFYAHAEYSKWLDSRAKTR